MAEKKRQKKKATIRSRIVTLINGMGSMKLRDMAKILDVPYKSLNTEALELRRLGILQKDEEGVWSLVLGVNPATFGIEISTSAFPPVLSKSESSRTLHDDFKDLLKSVGVKLAVDTIADIYFAGKDIWDARWLYRVLTKEAPGFVTEDQCKLIMGYWTRKSGVPYRFEDFFED